MTFLNSLHSCNTSDKVRLPLLLAFLFVLVGCRNDSTESSQQKQQESHSMNDFHHIQQESPTGQLIKAGPFQWQTDGLRFEVPEGWKLVELTALQEEVGFYVGRFLVPVAGQNVELTASLVAGGIERNLDRWKNLQFPVEQPVIDRFQVAERTITYIKLTGEFQSDKLVRDPHKGMLGAAIPLSPKGEEASDLAEALYLKLVASQAVIPKLQQEFREFVESCEISPQAGANK